MMAAKVEEELALAAMNATLNAGYTRDLAFIRGHTLKLTSVNPLREGHGPPRTPTMTVKGQEKEMNNEKMQD